jgi:hypothetical protein
MKGKARGRGAGMVVVATMAVMATHQMRGVGGRSAATTVVWWWCGSNGGGGDDGSDGGGDDSSNDGGFGVMVRTCRGVGFAVFFQAPGRVPRKEEKKEGRKSRKEVKEGN